MTLRLALARLRRKVRRLNREGGWCSHVAGSDELPELVWTEVDFVTGRPIDADTDAANAELAAGETTSLPEFRQEMESIENFVRDIVREELSRVARQVSGRWVDHLQDDDSSRGAA